MVPAFGEIVMTVVQVAVPVLRSPRLKKRPTTPTAMAAWILPEKPVRRSAMSSYCG
jgi:hypothetical protein